MIDSDAIEQYREHGWVVVEGVYTPEEAEQTAAIALDLCRLEMPAEVSMFTHDLSEDGQTAPRKIVSPFLKHQAFQAFVMDSRLEEILTRLLGEQPLLCADQIFMKPPYFGSAKPYHQDNFYFRCSPAEHVITAWIAMDDVDESNGCLRYISGSHTDGIIPHTPIPGEPHNLAPAEDLIDLNREALAPVRKGGVVFHHGETLHTSHRNESDRWRRGYATHWVTADVTSENDTIDRAYYKRPEYAAIRQQAAG